MFEETADRSVFEGAVPSEFAEPLARLGMAYQAAMTGLPIEEWRFESVRAGYEGLLKAHQENAALVSVIRSRLAEINRLETAADAARKAATVVARSHRRDMSLARTLDSLKTQEQQKSRSYRAIGMIQPSSRRFEGRKLYSLIASNGSRRAYLDLPPGVDAESLIGHRVGVRGSVNYDENLAARLISVRDLEEIRVRD
jgi:hypothetical protein